MIIKYESAEKIAFPFDPAFLARQEVFGKTLIATLRSIDWIYIFHRSFIIGSGTLSVNSIFNIGLQMAEIHHSLFHRNLLGEISINTDITYNKDNIRSSPLVHAANTTAILLHEDYMERPEEENLFGPIPKLMISQFPKEFKDGLIITRPVP